MFPLPTSSLKMGFNPSEFVYHPTVNSMLEMLQLYLGKEGYWNDFNEKLIFSTRKQKQWPVSVMIKISNPFHFWSPHSVADPTLWHLCKNAWRKSRISPWDSLRYLNNVMCRLTWKIHLQVLSTCVNPLPAHSEGSSGLNKVIGDGAAVVSAGAPRQLGCAVCHFLHRHRVWRAGGA